MRLNVIKLLSIEKYLVKNAGAKVVFKTWKTLASEADWETIHDLKKTFPSADPFGKKRVVFDIGGNKYRMICGYYFGKKKVALFIKWIGTHAEYTKLCNENKQYIIDDY